MTAEKAKVHCRVFEDNSGALEMATVHKYRPRTKHLNVKLHHFREYVESGEISIHKIDTTQQVADYLTKPLEVTTFERLRKQIMGWKWTRKFFFHNHYSYELHFFSFTHQPPHHHHTKHHHTHHQNLDRTRTSTPEEPKTSLDHSQPRIHHG